ncbi:hypothetical protein ABMA27_008511 [Loxostege sticticalis]|uniref:Transcription initiation protein SPT3 homolog n=1 Tax=Loxostege sticticalis TaxID=481309 RepID=A0ABR3HBL7_LOXSC
MVSYFASDVAGEVVNFQKEISSMMHGFGDNPNPNAATVLLVENIVLQQLRSMLQEGLNHSNMRGGKNISNYDIIYLMRKNLLKLKRLHEYQLNLDKIDRNRTSTLATAEPAIGNIMLEDDKEPIVKKRRTHIEVIKELDEADEVNEIKFDVIDYLRKVRAAKITESMTFEKYEAYHKARCTSFRSNNVAKSFTKLERWINPTKELKISMPALEVLSFLAYETVAEIVDSVFLIRQDAKKKSGDPFSKFEGGYFCNPVSLNNAVYIKSGYEGVPAITVAEVREVIRRYFTTRTGMNGLFYRNMSNDLPVRYIAI